MNDQTDNELASYFDAAGSWADDRAASQSRDRRVAWIVAAVAATIAVVEAIAILVMLPLQRIEPYTLLVDRQTGYVEALKPLERRTVAVDTALTRSFLVQYVIAREGFDIDSLKSDYRKVALWSAGEARDRYVAGMQASNPASPLASLPRQSLITVQIRSVAPLTDDTAMVRFETVRTDPGGQSQPPRIFAAVIKYRFSGAEMSAEDRLINPLGFQVLSYQANPEIESATPAPAIPAMAGPGVPVAPVRQVPVGSIPTGPPSRIPR